MDAVRKYRKHATDACPERLVKHAWVLIQVTTGKPGNETHRVRYAMRFGASRLDTANETVKLFGRKWRYFIEGTGFRILRHPFDIDDVKTSSTNYGQGAIRFVYVEKEDENAILSKGLLDGV
jgi:hypothetical protein